MLTQVKRIKLIGVLLCCLILSGSSNHLNAIGYWHALSTKANVLQNYWRFPTYFSHHLTTLPNTLLAKLARHSIPNAQYTYSLRLLNDNQGDTAKKFWFASINELTISQRKTLATHLLEQARWSDLKLLASINSLPAGDVLNHLKIEIKTPHNNISSAFISKLGFASLQDHLKPDAQCMFNVLAMSDHRSGLYKLSELINTYNKQPEPKHNIFCFSKPIYVAGTIECSNSVNQAAKCYWERSELKKQLPKNFDFIIMMPEQGMANVSKGTMLVNSTANYNVFLHELMHFSGFEDEYVLPKSKQAWLCAQSGYVAPNLYISQNNDAPIGWHKAKSCQKGGVAYKPSENWSIMQYQQLGLSAQYRAIWLKHLDMTSNQINSRSSALTFANKEILN